MLPTIRISRDTSVVASLTLLTILVLASTAHADWPVASKAVCTATADQTLVTSAPDDAGGTFMVWQDMRNGNQDVYAQHVNSAGILSWPAAGVTICNATGDQRKAVVLADGAGGAFFSWMDSRSGTFDVYVQRVNSAGTPLWTANGVVIASGVGNQDDPDIVADGAGGVIIAWEDSRSGLDDIYVQRVNGAGAPQWTANGVALCVMPDAQGNPTGVPDGAGGAIFAWQDARAGSGIDDIYARRINAAGAPQWTANGVAVSVAAEKQNDPVAISDGAGGAYIAWEDARSGSDDDIYVQKVNGSGVAQWTANGVGVCTAVDEQIIPRLAASTAGGVIVTWQDLRNASHEDIYAQRVNVTPQWTANGVAVCNAAGVQANPLVIPDGAGGAIVTWDDARSGNADIYAQRVKSDGNRLWAANGVAVAIAAGAQTFPQIVPSYGGGAILAWQDARSGTFDIYAQRISGTGGTVDVPWAMRTSGISLAPARPNPMKGQTTFRFEIPSRMHVTLAIYDAQGRRVRELARDVMEAGTKTLQWDGSDDRGRAVASGLYFGRLETPTSRRTVSVVALQ